MRKLSVTTALATIAIVLAPAVTVAQGTGSGGPSSASPTSQQGTSPPGTNSAGTAQCSGSPNTDRGVTTGSATRTESVDKAIGDENEKVDRRTRGICRGC
ncbi:MULTISPECIES: hypothetical protein [Bradyrhizobium]|uniref:Oxidoreductase n=1 Tax=Bradyrhizobium elkanii TaxID=29448 RepID=A0A4V6CXB0_BRAEL|nr:MULTISPECIES: hypothetical protein [Bradyrhizobium]MTV12071.1 hypothetical protein [Bradyrhizobium sp. BR2003]TKV79675.1 hypothetical protein FDV58_21210 [Bradyrhizobium elkanii]